MVPQPYFLPIQPYFLPIGGPKANLRGAARGKEMARFSRSIRRLGVAAALMTIIAGPVFGQGFDIRTLFGAPGPATGTVTPPAAAMPSDD